MRLHWFVTAGDVACGCSVADMVVVLVKVLLLAGGGALRPCRLALHISVPSVPLLNQVSQVPDWWRNRPMRRSLRSWTLCWVPTCAGLQVIFTPACTRLSLAHLAGGDPPAWSGAERVRGVFRSNRLIFIKEVQRIHTALMLVVVLLVLFWGFDFF